MSTLHHAAYDANLLGIDPDGGIHLNEELLRIRDGPILEYALKWVHGTRLRHPCSSRTSQTVTFWRPGMSNSPTQLDHECCAFQLLASPLIRISS